MTKTRNSIFSRKFLRHGAMVPSVGIVISTLATSLIHTDTLAAEQDGRATEQVENRRRGALEEIVVSARKREETVQNVPGSITAISAEQLRRERIQGLEDISQVAPSISWLQEQPGRGQLVMRGSLLAGYPTTGPRRVRAWGSTMMRCLWAPTCAYRI
ncbi:hypothetical protein [Kineobactrum salinum]|uniref:TonB-dependent receptor plug domain-containing protein n=1 Tax=Kineobactrum salinum TaxID=2708301 RepID=A0A6C0U3Q2_9GAMM|nr:hypothetical protein [Kineobactrum salinum]QIB66790.1 hypothetical protein G3T16_16715 [Kineobactrum salinum]